MVEGTGGEVVRITVGIFFNVASLFDAGEDFSAIHLQGG